MNREKLKDIIPFLSTKYKFRPAIIEKDFYITIILNDINSILSDKIVFKGGTLLNKIYFNYNRLSEDIDFTFCQNTKLNSRSERSRSIEQSSRRLLIIWVAVLSHHRTYRSVYGGSIELMHQ